MKRITLFKLTGLFLLTVFISSSQAQTDAWRAVADFGGSGRDFAVAFTIGAKGYAGMGYTGTTILNDLWEYDPMNDKWTRMSNAPYYRSSGFGFSIGNYGYVGSSTPFQDLSRYDPSTNNWTVITTIPGPERYGKPTAFVIGNKAYVGLGFDTSNVELKDLWEYNPDNNSWKRMADFPSLFTAGVASFSIGSKGYVCSGNHGNIETNQLWEFDPATDQWTQKKSVGFDGRYGSVGFSLNNKGYLGLGYVSNIGVSSDFWEYDPATDNWTQVASCDLGGYNAYAPVAFTIGNRAYAGTGVSSNSVFQKSFFEYNLNTGIKDQGSPGSFHIYPNPGNGRFSIRSSLPFNSFEISDIRGLKVSAQRFNQETDSEELEVDLPAGIYFIKLLTDQGTATEKFVVN